MEDEDMDERSTSQERIKVLGFKPQKEIVYNHILPYAKDLDDESTKFFNEIKSNFGKAVMIKEMKPGCGVWTSRLMKYIKLYGLKFSKEDHIKLIHLVYELIIIPELEPTKLHKFSTLLILLTKKRHLISPDELTIPWRPLYDIAQKIFSKSLSIYHYFSTKNSVDDVEANSPFHRLLKALGIKLPSPMAEASAYDCETLESTFDYLIMCVKPYFPISATREIIDEIMPRFSPWTCATQECIQQLMLYLPYSNRPQDMDQGFRLWFDDLMSVWQICNNAPPWESEIMILMANTAHNNIGYIDWQPHIPLMFTRFLRSFNLPVFYKQTQSTKQHSIDICGMALWIVSAIGPNSSAQTHLDNFMTTVVTYLHSANYGRWSVRLRDLLRKLPHTFVQRVHRERTNYKLTWENKVPDSHKLTEDDITRFVECMLNVALQAMFSRMGISDACAALQHLAVLRPAMVVAPTVEKMWNSLDSLTEPHKLTCAMLCVIAVARPLVSGHENGYPEGPTHVIPLLFSSLPGLDPNDFKKTLVTLHFIAVFSTFIPLVDCSGASEYWKDLTEEEHTVCESTAQIEDFVLQFFDRVFALVESSIMEHTRMEQKESESVRNKLESTSEGALASAAISVLMQSSTNIFKMALKKFHTFVTDRILETNVAGQTAASLCKAFARVNAKETFKVFIPYLCDSITNLLGDNVDIAKEENLDNELLFNLLLLSHIVEHDGKEILLYVPRILTVLDKTLNLISKKGYGFASSTLQNLILSMSSVYPRELKSSTKNYDAGVKEFLAIREWGKPGKVGDCNLQWHTPGKDEVECVQDIMNRYLPKELDRIKGYIDGTVSLTREELNRSLCVLKALMAANPFLPQWDEEAIVLIETKLPPSSFSVKNGIVGTVTMPDGSNVRKVVAEVMHKLQIQLLNSSEDDTKNLCSLISIWEQLVAYSNSSSGQFENHLKAFRIIKRALEDRLLGRPGHPRTLIIDRALLQQEFRLQASTVPFCKTHAMIMADLLELATSRYSAVRMRAQIRLNWMISHYTYSFNSILPQLVDCLASDPETNHERLKGALYCLLGPKQTPLVAKHDWHVVAALWPAFVLSKPSEKPSVIRLLERIVNAVHLHFPTITIKQQWTESSLEKAKALLSKSELEDPHLISLMEQSDETTKKNSDQNVKIYTELTNVLVKGAESTQNHWRHSMMCISLLPSLAHKDVQYPPQVVRIILNSLIHDSIHVRKIGIKMMVLCLKQRKRKHKTVEVDPFKMAGITRNDEVKLIPGFRSDNAWLQYDCSKLFSEDEWDKSPYLHKEFYGFYKWPKSLKMYAPPEDQPEYNSSVILDSSDKEIFDFFSTKENVDKLITFLCIEEKKGKDKFSGFRYSLFKDFRMIHAKNISESVHMISNLSILFGVSLMANINDEKLFRIYGDSFLDLFMDHLERLVSDKQESFQRCAAEIIAGIIKGTKHWPFEKVDKLRCSMCPVMRCALENMTTETFGDWGTCFATASERMDLSRIGWVIEVLEEAGGSGAIGGSAVECGRLYALQAAVVQHPWRGAAYAKRLVDLLREERMLWHPYQIVRDRVASLMTNLFEMDIKFPGGTQNVGPSIEEMMNEIAPKLVLLLEEGLKGVTNANDHSSKNHATLPYSIDSMEIDSPSRMTEAGFSPKKIHTSIAISPEKFKSLIQDTMEKNGLEKGNITLETMNKLMQEFKKSNIEQRDDSPALVKPIKDAGNGRRSSMESFMQGSGFLEAQNSPFAELPIVSALESQLASGLRLSVAREIASSTNENVPITQLKEESEYDANLRLFKTAMKWVTNAVVRSPFSARSCYYILVPAACALGSREGDEELCRICISFLAALAQSLHDTESLRVALDTVGQVCKSPSWCARASCLGFLQSLVFYNMALAVGEEEGRLSIQTTVLSLMADLRPEVREAAAQMMAGLLHCGAATEPTRLLDQFKSLCSGGKMKKGGGGSKALADRHCGVLGLCAFVAAHPYSVPPYLPEIFQLLGRHLNDPMPIPSTIRKTLGDFKRTHHDDWQNHQLKFTEDELCLLSDLTIPPSYYA